MAAAPTLASLMLAGWTLLGDVCPVEGCHTPLVRSRDGKTHLCAKCNRDTRTDARGAPALATRQAEERAAREAAMPRLAPPPPGVAKRENAAEAIAQKMLRGWALLDRHCPREECGHCPLVRNREKTVVYCCGCDMPVVAESAVPAVGPAAVAEEPAIEEPVPEAEPERAQRPPARVGGASRRARRLAREEEDEEEEEEEEEEDNVTEAKGRRSVVGVDAFAYAPLPAEEGLAATAAAPASVEIPAQQQLAHAGYDAQLARAVAGHASRATHTLVKKLMHVRALLESESDVERIGKLAATLAEVARALQATKTLSSQ